MKTQLLEATSSTEPTYEAADPALQVSQQMDPEIDTSREPDFESGGIRKTLVIEPTHPSNSGTYYCATADDVAQLIVKNQGDLSCKGFFFKMYITYDYVFMQLLVCFVLNAELIFLTVFNSLFFPSKNNVLGYSTLKFFPLMLVCSAIFNIFVLSSS